MADDVGNYTVGRGEVHFARFLPGTLTRGPYRYIGNTPEMSTTVDTQNLDHVSSDRGIRQKDASMTIEVDRSISIVADEISGPNLALYFFSDVVPQTVVGGGSAATETFTAVKTNHWYPLGVTDTDPIGVLKAVYPGASGTLFAVKDSPGGTTTYDAGTDYIYDTVTGMVKILAGGDIADGDDISITYTEAAYTYDQIASGSQPVEGALLYITRNPVGPNRKFFFPYVKLRPNGDYNLKGDDWQTLPFVGECLVLGDLEALYITQMTG